MAVAATIKPFTSRMPTVVVFDTSDNFNAAAQTGTPTVAGGVVTYPQQAGGGLFKLHDKAIQILEVAYIGSGSTTFVKKINETGTMTITGLSLSDLKNATLLPGEWLEFSSTGAGAKQLVIKAQELPLAVGV